MKSFLEQEKGLFWVRCPHNADILFFPRLHGWSLPFAAAVMHRCHQQDTCGAHAAVTACRYQPPCRKQTGPLLGLCVVTGSPHRSPGKRQPRSFPLVCPQGQRGGSLGTVAVGEPGACSETRGAEMRVRAFVSLRITSASFWCNAPARYPRKENRRVQEKVHCKKSKGTS